MINSKFLSFSSMNTSLLAISKVTDARRDPSPCSRPVIKKEMVNYVVFTPFTARFSPEIFYVGVLRFQIFPSAFPSPCGVLFRRIIHEGMSDPIKSNRHRTRSGTKWLEQEPLYSYALSFSVWAKVKICKLLGRDGSHERTVYWWVIDSTVCLLCDYLSFGP